MAPILHLTNGSAIIPMMRAAGVTGPIVPWDDVLHEGPVPAGLNTAALRDVRASFLAGCGWDARERIVRLLAERDAALDRGAEEIVLWFEHDLFDQLHVLQILDRLPIDGPPRVTAVPDDDYLGQLQSDRFQGLFAARRDVTSAQRSAARDAWTAFRSIDPRGLIDVLPRVTVLPHLGPALTRHLQQFPSTDNGLSRTEQQALEVMATGVTTVSEIFVKSHIEREAAFFMGDSGFVLHLGALMRTTRPLIRVIARAEERLAIVSDSQSVGARSTPSSNVSLDIADDVEITDDGRRVLEGQIDRVTLCGIDRWLGGVHLTGHGPLWRWDGARNLVRLV
jgi:hypothetical protein